MEGQSFNLALVDIRLPDAVFVKDRECRFIAANAAQLRLLAQPRHQDGSSTRSVLWQHSRAKASAADLSKLAEGIRGPFLQDV